jgi:NADPH2:quinone reductase
MRALLCEGIGFDQLALRDVPEPEPKADEVRIRVHACGINYPDVLLIEDRYQFHPDRPFAPGGEVSGVVDAIGPGVAGLRPGSRVAAMIGWGGLAEKVIAKVERVIPIPDSIAFDEAAGLLVTYGTSLYALKDRAALEAGETVLILGAAGGVGYAALELAKMMGARVIAAVSSASKADVVRQRGADAVIIYPLEVQDPRALAAQFKAACPAGADVIYDAVGGPYAEPALRTIAWEGRYLVVGFPAGIPSFSGNLPLLKGCQIVGVFWGAAFERDPAHHRALLSELMAHHRAGLIRPLISARYPLARGAEAIAALRARTAVGKLVVTLD